MKALCIIIIAAAICARNASADAFTSTEFVAYHGPQQDWKLTDDARVEHQFALPVYLGAADQRYDVIGYCVVFAHDPKHLDDAARPYAMRCAATAARIHHADAVIVQPIGALERERAKLNPGQRHIFMVAAAIKWK